MKTLAQWKKQINDSGRIMSEVTLSEAQHIIGCIAMEWMWGHAKTLTYPVALQSISLALKTSQERRKDYKTIGEELVAIGGSKISEAKTKAVRENGKKGGRPKSKKVEK